MKSSERNLNNRRTRKNRTSASQLNDSFDNSNNQSFNYGRPTTTVDDIPIVNKGSAKTFEQMIEEELAKEANKGKTNNRNVNHTIVISTKKDDKDEVNSNQDATSNNDTNTKKAYLKRKNDTAQKS